MSAPIYELKYDASLPNGTWSFVWGEKDFKRVVYRCPTCHELLVLHEAKKIDADGRVTPTSARNATLAPSTKWNR